MKKRHGNYKILEQLVSEKQAKLTKGGNSVHLQIYRVNSHRLAGGVVRSPCLLPVATSKFRSIGVVKEFDNIRISFIWKKWINNSKKKLLKYRDSSWNQLWDSMVNRTLDVLKANHFYLMVILLICFCICRHANDRQANYSLNESRQCTENELENASWIT